MMAFRLARDDVIQAGYVNIEWSKYFEEPLCSWMYAYTYSLTQTLHAKVSVKGNETMTYKGLYTDSYSIHIIAILHYYCRPVNNSVKTSYKPTKYRLFRQNIAYTTI